MGEGELILIAGGLLAAGLVATLVAGRLRVPGLVLFLLLGMAIGSDGAGWIPFDDYELTRTIGVIALALILFEGGLSSGHVELRSVLRPALSLAVVGTIATAAVVGLAAAWLFDFTLLEGLLVGSVLASTDGAAVFGLLRASTLRRRLAGTLEAEAGLNDPIAVLLVIGFVEWLERPGYGIADMSVLFVAQLAIGGGAGVVLGWGSVRAFRHLRLPSAGLYPVASITVAALAFGAAETLGGSGFLAVYLAGLALGGAPIPAKRTITAFHEGLAWVGQIVMFFALGLLVFPGQLADVALDAGVLTLVLVFVARPAATFLATAFESFSTAERVLLGWAGLRGAVPVVLATFPVIAGVPHAAEFFNIAFFAVLISTLVQGATFEPLARALGLTTSEPALPRPLTETGTIRRLGAEVVEFPVAAGDAIVGHRVRDLDLPREALLNVIVRDQQAIPPRGSTLIEAGDRLHILVRQEVAHQIDALIGRWRAGPIGPPPRPERARRGSAAVFSARPFTAADGDPASPRELRGIAVAGHLRTRRDRPGALVALADGRYAVTGPVLAIGGHTALQRYARARLDRPASDAEHAWWEEVVGALASSRNVSPPRAAAAAEPGDEVPPRGGGGPVPG